LTNSPGTIDADYVSEIKVILENRGNQPFVVENGMRICQGVVKQFEQAHFMVVDEIAETGRGGFGSTGTN
jgi:dUTP pyrophosphatase